MDFSIHVHIPWSQMEENGFPHPYWIRYSRTSSTRPCSYPISDDGRINTGHTPFLFTKAAPVESPVFETLTREENVAAIQVQESEHGIEQEKLPPEFQGILNSLFK